MLRATSVNSHMLLPASWREASSLTRVRFPVGPMSLPPNIPYIPVVLKAVSLGSGMHRETLSLSGVQWSLSQMPCVFAWRELSHQKSEVLLRVLSAAEGTSKRDIHSSPGKNASVISDCLGGIRAQGWSSRTEWLTHLE